MIPELAGAVACEELETKENETQIPVTARLLEDTKLENPLMETLVVYDVIADRMRIVIPITEADELEPERLARLMQANFDSALDARYAIARGKLWGTFIHPLSTLTDEEFLVGLGQTANVVMSYGTSYSSGMFTFGGGDSAEIERQRLIEKLRKKKI